MTILALLYERDRSLPESPASLFRQIVEVRWLHEAGQREHPDAWKVRGFTFAAFKRALGDLAYAMIEAGKGTSVDIPWAEKQIRSTIGKRARELLFLGEACSVLSLIDQNVRFFHQLLQEFFAALSFDWLGDHAAHIQHWWPWQEVLLMRAGMGKVAEHQVISECILAFQTTGVAWSAAKLLERIGEPAVELLVAALEHADVRVRQNTAMVLERLGWKPGDKEQRIHYLIARGDWDALAQCGAPAIEPLIKVLLGNDLAIRRAAASVLGQIGDTRAVESLIDSLNYPDAHLRRVAVEALGRIGDTRAVVSLRKKLQDADTSVRRAVVRALGQIVDAQTLDPLIEAIADTDILVRQEAALALKSFGGSAVEPLIRVLGNTDAMAVQDAIWALSMIGSAAVQPLIVALGDDNVRLREYAAKALIQIGEPAVKPLSITLRRGDERMRLSAARALFQIGSREARAALRDQGYNVS